jgi:hypothetical protein
MRYEEQGEDSFPSQALHIYHSFNINPRRRYAPMQPFTSQLKHTGDRNTASYRGAFRFACVQDRGCRGTSRGGALSVLLMQDKRGTVGFGAGGGLGFVFKQIAQYMIFQQQKIIVSFLYTLNTTQ